MCDLCKTKAGTKCGKGGKFLLPGGICANVADGQVCDEDTGCLECKEGKHKTWTLGTDKETGYKCVESRRRLDGPAARPAWATGAPQEKASPRLPSWASEHRILKEGKGKKGKGSCFIPGNDEFLPVCKPVGKCGKCAKGSYVEDEEQCVTTQDRPPRMTDPHRFSGTRSHDQATLVSSTQDATR